jgi:hypothetical protein
MHANITSIYQCEGVSAASTGNDDNGASWGSLLLVRTLGVEGGDLIRVKTCCSPTTALVTTDPRRGVLPATNPWCGGSTTVVAGGAGRGGRPEEGRPAAAAASSSSNKAVMAGHYSDGTCFLDAASHGEFTLLYHGNRRRGLSNRFCRKLFIYTLVQ